MTGISRPRPCYLDGMESCGAPGGHKRWRNAKHDRLFTWDNVHGHIEVFDRRGHHVGVVHAVTGEFIGRAVRGRRIDV
jgi:hypothetical protein